MNAAERAAPTYHLRVKQTPAIEFRLCLAGVRNHQGGRRRQFRRLPRRVRGPRRTQWIRQDHDADARGRLRDPELRRGADQRNGGHSRSAAPAEYRRRLPKLRVVPAPDGRAEHRVSVARSSGPAAGHRTSASPRHSSSCAYPDVGHRYPSQLSGGQQQRVAVARAIVFGPSVLLMDEPLGALDRSLREEMQYELKSLQQELQVTVLYVTHDQGEAMAMADRIGVMKDARLLQLADPQTLYHAPADRFVASFVGECNFINGSAGSRGVEVAGRTVPTQANNPPAGDVALAVRPQSIRVTHLPSGDVVEAGELPAVVRNITFLGSLTRLHLVLDDGQSVIAVLDTGNPAASLLTSGDRVSIGWSEVIVYPDPDVGAQPRKGGG